MRAIWIRDAALASAWMLSAAGTAGAQPILLHDVVILYQPQPSGYQPQGSDIDLSDQGKSFNISCRIAADGHMTGCVPQANDMNDGNFVEVAVANVSQWVVAPQTRDGRSTAGQNLTVACAFHRTDIVAEASKIALAQ